MKTLRRFPKYQTLPHVYSNSILVVDDCTDSLELHKQILELEGYEVFTANGAIQAFNFLDENPPPHLILLDVQMKEMSGPDFLLLFEKRNSTIFDRVSVVFHTGNSEVPISTASGLIQKARGLDSFRSSIREFMNSERSSSF